MKPGIPTIVRAAERLLYEVESAVTAFPRKHRYALGSDMRTGAVEAVVLTQQAFRATRNKPLQVDLINRLAQTIDTLKVRIKLARHLQCYSAGRFEAIARIVVDLGKQCGGWKKQIELHLSGQSPAPSRQPERAQILSTHAASAEAIR